MARLPDFTDLGQRPVPQASEGVAEYQPPNWRQVGMAGQILSSAGNEIQQAGEIVAQTNLQQDQISALDGANRLKQATLQLEQDPQNGFLNVKGNGVVGPDFVKNYTDQYNNQVKAIGESLANDNQRRIFQQHAQVVGLMYQSHLLHHQSVETALFNKETQKAQVDIGLNNIAAHPMDDHTYDAEMLNISNSVWKQIQSEGFTGQDAGDQFDARMRKHISDARATQILGRLQTDPKAAVDFYNQHEQELDWQTRDRLGGTISKMGDALSARTIGQKTFAEFAQGTPGSATPQDMGAPNEKPMDQKRIGEIVDFVKKPSPWEQAINDAAKQYGVSPSEIKLKIGLESSGNPNAVNPTELKGGDHATGLGQFTAATAAEYGVHDRKDPVQSIFGIARFLAANGGTLGSDMKQADQAYIGKGKDADQYVENTRAIRQQLYGGGGQAPKSIADLEAALGPMMDAARAQARLDKPGNPEHEDMAAMEASRLLRQTIEAKKGQEYSNMSQILQSSIGPSGAKSLSDLSPAQQVLFSQLEPEHQHSLYNLWDSNQRKDQVETPEKTQRYMALMGLAQTDPASFKDTTLHNIPNEIQDLPRWMQERVLNAWTSIDKNEAKGAQTRQALGYLQKDLINAKVLLPNGKEKPGSNDYQAFAGMLRQSMDEFITEKKKQPTQDDIQELAKPIFKNFTISGGGFMGLDTSKPGYRLTMKDLQNVSPQDIQIPTEKATQLTNAFRQRYGDNPSSQELQALWLIDTFVPREQQTAAMKAYDQDVLSGRAAKSGPVASTIINRPQPPSLTAGEEAWKAHHAKQAQQAKK